MGTQSVRILINLNLALANSNIIVPTVDELSRYKTAQEVEDIPIPATIGLVGFEGLAIFIPGPFLQDAVITSNSNDPFNLIVISCLDMYRTKVLMYRTMVLMACLTKVRR